MRLVDISQYINRQRKHDYDVYVHTYDFVIPPTLSARNNFHSSALALEGSRNYVGVNEPVVDRLVEAAEAAQSLSELVAASRALDRVMMWGYYLIPVYAYDPRRTVYWDKFGSPPQPLYRPAFPDGWWYEKDKAERIRQVQSEMY